jgi:hypothetical protein
MVSHGLPGIPAQVEHNLVPTGNVPGFIQFADAVPPADRHVVPLSAMITPFSRNSAYVQAMDGTVVSLYQSVTVVPLLLTC